MSDPYQRVPMPPSPPLRARDTARQLLLDESGETPDEQQLFMAAERVCARVCIGLARWFGPFGAAALMGRALARAQAEHPALLHASIVPDKSPCLEGLTTRVDPRHAGALSEGLIVLLATLTDLIGRLVGDDLAFSLLVQSAAADSTNTPSDAAAAGSNKPMDDQ
ncbi:MAG: hypothetical protein JWM95_5536 [Gemmatimonadetes bacterium]|nr:hypothetical protein [Gemmatimonadota bacterium]